MSIYMRRRAHPARPFVIAFLLICGLASLSLLREATFARQRPLEASIARRDFSIGEEKSEICRHVHGHQDECAFIRLHCPDEEAGLLSYLELYYCQLPNLKPLAFMIIALWASLLFATIGIAASDFFCINLNTISNILGMSESMAGVTFLAFGNGSPDVFSTFAAIKSHSGSLAIGELIGAAGFITAVVSGSMALVRPFTVATKSFVRDISFFIVAVGFSMVFLANGNLTVWECAVMVGFYVFYVVVVVCWHWWLGRRKKRREREAAIRGHYDFPEGQEIEAEEEYHDDPDDENSRRSYARPVSTQDFNDLEQADFPDYIDNQDMDDEETRDKWMGELSSNMRITRPPAGDRAPVYTPIRPSLVGALEFRAVLASLQKSRNIQSLPINMRRYSDVPEFTTAQQQDNASTSSDPEGAQNAYQASMQAETVGARPRASTEGQFGTRIPTRASTTGNVANLRIDSDILSESPRQSVDLLGDSPPQSPPASKHGKSKHGSSHASHQEPTLSPIVSVSSPPSETEARDDFEPGLPDRTNSADLLAPPRREDHAPRHHSKSFDGSWQTKDHSNIIPRQRPERPGLKIPPSPSLRSSTRNTPISSPYIMTRSRTSSTTPSLLLPPPSQSDESYFRTQETQAGRPLKWWPYKIFPPPLLVIRTLFPTLYNWREKTLWEKFLGVCSAPSFFLLTITLPVVEPSNGGSKEEERQEPTYGGAPRDFAEPGDHRTPEAPPHPHSSAADTAVAIEQSHYQDQPNGADSSSPPAAAEHTSVATTNSREWNRWLVIVQSFTAPWFIVFIVWANMSGQLRELIKPTIYSLLGSSIFLCFLLVTTSPTRPPKWHFILCFVGFAVSITWISTIANEVVGVLKTIGVIFNMSDAILGLTIFAVGNSLGDLVADITVARLGFPVMALSACFGGPMLNILLGVGLSGLYMTINGAEKRQHKHPDSPLKFKPYRVEVSTTLLISAVALLVTLIGLLIVVPLNKWKMDRKIGWGLIGLWIIATVTNVIVEVTGLAEDVTK